MTELSEQRRPPAERGAWRKKSGVAMVCDFVSTLVLCAATVTGLLANIEPEKPTVEATMEPSPVSQSVRQEGTIIAVSAGSVTARSADGYTQTYLVTPNTTVITYGGSQPATATSRFAINDRVDIVGTVRNGTALATTVADRDLTNGNGPPMDYIAGQPIGAAHGAA